MEDKFLNLIFPFILMISVHNIFFLYLSLSVYLFIHWYTLSIEQLLCFSVGSVSDRTLLFFKLEEIDNLRLILPDI